MALLDELGQSPAFLVGHPLADVDVAIETGGYLTPPGGDSGKSASRFPIDLGCQKINGTASHPRHRVAVDLVILPVGAGAGLHTILGCHSGRAARHTCRTDTEAHPRLGLLDHVVHVTHHHVDVLAAPVALRHRAARSPVGVVQVGIERERRVVLVVEIVVEHESIDVIFHNDVLAHVHHTLTHLGDTGIEYRLIAGGQQPLGMGIDIIPLALAPHVAAMAVAVGIDPGIDLNAALVGLLDQIAKGVERRGHATGARDIARPRLIGRIVHRVTHRTHVIIDHVDVVHAHRVKHLATGILHRGRIALGNGTAGPIVEVGRHPDAPLLAFGHRVGSRGKTGGKCRQ